MSKKYQQEIQSITKYTTMQEYLNADSTPYQNTPFLLLPSDNETKDLPRTASQPIYREKKMLDDIIYHARARKKKEV